MNTLVVLNDPAYGTNAPTTDSGSRTRSPSATANRYASSCSPTPSPAPSPASKPPTATTTSNACSPRHPPPRRGRTLRQLHGRPRHPRRTARQRSPALHPRRAHRLDALGRQSHHLLALSSSRSSRSLRLLARPGHVPLLRRRLRSRSRYLAVLERALAPDGAAVIATFAPDAPDHCSRPPPGRPLRRRPASPPSSRPASSSSTTRGKNTARRAASSSPSRGWHFGEAPEIIRPWAAPSTSCSTTRGPGSSASRPAEALAAAEIGALIIDIRADLDRERARRRARLRPHPAHGSRMASRSREPLAQLRTSASSTGSSIILCDHGYSSSLAAATLVELGLDATDVIGGFEAWQETRLPVTAPDPPTRAGRARRDGPARATRLTDDPPLRPNLRRAGVLALSSSRRCSLRRASFRGLPSKRRPR